MDTRQNLLSSILKGGNKENFKPERDNFQNEAQSNSNDKNDDGIDPLRRFCCSNSIIAFI